MYHFIEDKEFLKRMRNLCSGIINQLVVAINNEDVMTVEAHLVGSGARNLEIQNANEPIDLDYNLVVINSKKYDINDGKEIKEYIRMQFNEILNNYSWGDCQDSTSCLSTKYQYFIKGNDTNFKIDLAIVHEDPDGTWYRLIHNKTGFIKTDTWIWNVGPNSKGLTDKSNKLKNNNFWEETRETYLDKKNMYLSRMDYNHPSFNCYIEAVNEVYRKYFK